MNKVIHADFSNQKGEGPVIDGNLALNVQREATAQELLDTVCKRDPVAENEKLKDETTLSFAHLIESSEEAILDIIIKSNYGRQRDYLNAHVTHYIRNFKMFAGGFVARCNKENKDSYAKIIEDIEIGTKRLINIQYLLEKIAENRKLVLKFLNEMQKIRAQESLNGLGEMLKILEIIQEKAYLESQTTKKSKSKLIRKPFSTPGFSKTKE